ncbi:protein-glutamate O-methyltransferase CheR [Sphingorhabdus sp. IMCC26285]|uniref:Protein-glutamate O-methyltransferase CheR n=2 Tax=Sphingorhabdus profundilacus TaxID=2509718 RepID=A0A6I4LVZ5_9SPHN|nr:protein-glutamate O-methyltransferase CheR [Sphingorhabdus profundilacus]
MVQSQAYTSLSNLLEKHTGQTLMANRHWRIDMALKPLMRENSIPDLDTLISLIDIDADPKLTSACVEAMVNNETCFFRDQANFALLTGPVLDMLREQRMGTKKLRIWSAACSTGQEPYSLAMAFNENAEKWRGWNIQIFATDVSSSALAQARAGRYSQFEIQRGLPVMQMLRYFDQSGEDWIAKENLRRAVTFTEHNMLNPAPHFGKFDVVLCRNMLMYLGEKRRTQVLDAIGTRMADDGILMLGAAETVIGQTQDFRASQEFRGFYEPVSRAASHLNAAHRIFG